MKINILASRIFLVACIIFIANMFMGMIKEKPLVQQCTEIRNNLPQETARNKQISETLDEVQISLLGPELDLSSAIRLFETLRKGPIKYMNFATNFGTLTGEQLINLYFGNFINQLYKKISTQTPSATGLAQKQSATQMRSQATVINEFNEIVKRLPETGQNIPLLKKPLAVVHNVLSQQKPDLSEALTVLQKIRTSNFLKNTQFGTQDLGVIPGQQLFSIYFDDFIKRLEMQIQTAQAHKSGTPHGLENKGNTCFMNAAIQCFASLDKITQVLLTHSSDTYYKPNTISAAYIQLLNVMQHEPKAVIDPLPFCLLGWNIIPGAEKGRQQDAGEFMQFLLQALAGTDIKQPTQPGMPKIKNEEFIKLLAIEITERSYDSKAKITSKTDTQHLIMPPISISSSDKTLLDCLKSLFHLESHPSQPGALRLTGLTNSSNYFIVNLRRTGWSQIKNEPFKN